MNAGATRHRRQPVQTGETQEQEQEQEAADRFEKKDVLHDMRGSHEAAVIDSRSVRRDGGLISTEIRYFKVCGPRGAKTCAKLSRPLLVQAARRSLTLTVLHYPPWMLGCAERGSKRGFGREMNETGRRGGLEETI